MKNTNTTVSAVIGHYSEPATQVDPSRLAWAPGYPGHDGSTRIQWAVWNGQTRLAHLECAIVRDTVSHLVVDAPGVCHYEHPTAMYDYVRDERLAPHESHHPYMAWRIVREDGVVLYDSLTQAGEHHRVVHADVPLAWGSVVRQLRNGGQLPRQAA